MRWVPYQSGEQGHEDVGLVRGGQVRGLRGDVLGELLRFAHTTRRAKMRNIEGNPYVALWC